MPARSDDRSGGQICGGSATSNREVILRWPLNLSKDNKEVFSTARKHRMKLFAEIAKEGKRAMKIKHSMIRHLCLGIWLTASFFLSAQNEYLDSLKITLAEETEDSLKVPILRKLAWASLSTDLTQARQYSEMIQLLATGTKNEFQYSTGTYYLGLISRLEGKYAEAIEFLNQALVFYQSDTLYEFSSTGPLFNLAAVYMRVGEYEKAIYYLLQELEINERFERPRSVANSLNTLGTINQELKNFEDAKGYYYRAIALAEQTKDSATLGITLDNLSATYLESDQLDSAYLIAQRNLQIRKKINNIDGLMQGYLTMANIYERMDSIELGLTAARKSLHHSEKLGHNHGKSSAHLTLSSLYRAQNRQDSALAHLNNVLASPEKESAVKNRIEALKSLRDIKKSQARYREALDASDQIRMLTDSIYTSEKENIVKNIEAKYALKEKERAIDQLNQDNAQKSIALTNSKRYNLILITALLVAGITILLVVRIYNLKLYAKQLAADRENQKILQLEQERDLTILNSMIEGQEQERSRIAQDLHDGLGGLMSSIKSHFQNIQTEIEKIQHLKVYEKTKSLINEASEEVRRISHNMMPSSLQILGLNAAVEDLAQKTQKSGLNTNAEIIGRATKLEEARAIMIYRIIQEATHNALKHAGAKNLLIQLLYSDTHLSIIIEDDGVGFRQVEITEGLGIKGIRSRVAYLDGEIEIITTPNQGTSIQIEIPLSNHAPDSP